LFPSLGAPVGSSLLAEMIMTTLNPFRARGSRLVRTLGAATLVGALSASRLTAQAAAPAGPSEQGAIMTVVTTLFDGMRKGDSSMVRSVFDPRVRMITVSMRNGTRRTTVETGADNFAKAVGTPHADVWDERIRNERVSVDGDLASVWVDYAFFAGTKFSHCGIDHFLLVRNESGAWKILELSDTRRTTGCEQWTR
jgi:Putative lumazine-binding